MNDFTLCEHYKAEIDAFRPFPPETARSLRDYYRIAETQKELLRLLRGAK